LQPLGCGLPALFGQSTIGFVEAGECRADLLRVADAREFLAIRPGKPSGASATSLDAPD